MTHRFLALTILSCLLAACAPLHRQVPAYPGRGQTAEQIQSDMAACTSWAKASTDDPGASAAIGTGAGAVIVGGVGAAFGAVLYALLKLDPAEGAAIGASLGGIMGAAEGAGAAGASAEQRRKGAYAACMSARGYTVSL